VSTLSDRGPGPDRGERRQGPRVDLLAQFQGHLITLDEEIRVLQLGPGGVTVAAAIPLVVDHEHDLQLTIGDERVTVRARVAHARTTIDRDEFTYVAGMAFVNLSPAAANAIDTFLARTDAQGDALGEGAGAQGPGDRPR
jgi:hypothetical protein